MKTLASLGKAAGPALLNAAPGALQGAAQGGSVGGPYGALIGAGVGLASGLIQQQAGGSGPARAPVAAAPAPAQGFAAKPTTIAPLAAAPATSPTGLPVGQDAAATVFGLLQNSLIQQALLSQVLGSSGRPTVQAPSGAELPRASINQLLAQLLANAAEGLPESESIAEQNYLMDDAGEYLVDPASPEQQAAMVLAHLQTRAGDTVAEARAGGAYFWDELEWIGEDAGEGVGSLSESFDEMVEFY